jgi:hypothetical protein
MGPKLRAHANADVVSLAEVRERRRAAKLDAREEWPRYPADWIAEVNARERARRKRLEWLAVAAVWGLGVAIVIVCEIFN